MTPEDIRKEAEEISKQIGQEKDAVRESRYIYWILAVLLAVMIILMVIPNYTIKLNPRPSRIPSASEVVGDLTVPDIAGDRSQGEAFLLRIKTRQDIKMTADRIAALACSQTAGMSENKVCHARALYGFVQQNMQYIGDPPDEYLKTPEESLLTLGGDCDDHSILLSSLLTAVGIRNRLVFIPRHVFVQAYIEEAPAMYQDEYGWTTMDATCKQCEFGENPNSLENNRYLYI